MATKATHKTIQLEFPVDVKGPQGGTMKLTEVTIRRLKVADLEMLPEDSEDFKKPKMMIPLIAAISGQEVATIREIDLEDLGKIVTALTDFLAGYLGTGKSGDKSSGVSP